MTRLETTGEEIRRRNKEKDVSVTSDRQLIRCSREHDIVAIPHGRHRPIGVDYDFHHLLAGAQADSCLPDRLPHLLPTRVEIFGLDSAGNNYRSLSLGQLVTGN